MMSSLIPINAYNQSPRLQNCRIHAIHESDDTVWCQRVTLLDHETPESMSFVSAGRPVCPQPLHPNVCLLLFSPQEGERPCSFSPMRGSLMAREGRP